MTLKEKLIDVANGLESESIRYPRMKTIDVVNMLINISNMEFDESDQCVQIAKDYAEQEAIEFSYFIASKGFNKYTQKSYCGKTLMWFTDKKGLGVTTDELYQLFKNRENER